MEIASAGNTGLVLGNSSLSFSISADTPVPTVSLNYDGDVTVSGFSIQRTTIELSESLSGHITVNITNTGTATYGDYILN